MHEAGDLHPLGLPIATDGLRCLEEVLDLGELGLEYGGEGAREGKKHRARISDCRSDGCGRRRGAATPMLIGGRGREDAHIGVRLVHEGVELLHRLPDACKRNRGGAQEARSASQPADKRRRRRSHNTRTGTRTGTGIATGMGKWKGAGGGYAPIRACTVFLNSARTRTLNSTVCFSKEPRGQGGGNQPRSTRVISVAVHSSGATRNSPCCSR